MAVRRPQWQAAGGEKKGSLDAWRLVDADDLQGERKSNAALKNCAQEQIKR
jgi:hypothetical protein